MEVEVLEERLSEACGKETVALVDMGCDRGVYLASERYVVHGHAWHCDTLHLAIENSILGITIDNGSALAAARLAISQPIAS
jgi:hypothetical protein